MTRLLALALVAACGNSAPPAGETAASTGHAVAVVVVVDGVARTDVGPALEALSESLASGSRVEVVEVSGDLGASLDRAAAILESSKAGGRAIIAIEGGAVDLAAHGDRITALRRAGVLGYGVHYGAGAAGMEAIGYTMTRRAQDPRDLRGVVGAIGASLGSR